MSWTLLAILLVALALAGLWWLGRRAAAAQDDGAALMPAETWQRFQALVAEHTQARYPGSRIEDGVVHSAGGQQYGLQNLAQRCAQAEPDEWPEMLREHFDHLDRAQAASEDLENEARDYERIADLLSVRLWPEAFAEGEIKDNLVARRDLEGTLSVLVYDLPSTVQNVGRKQFELWGRSEDEVFARALANLARQPVERGEHELGDGLRLYLFAGDHFFVASHALRLDHYRDSLGPEGAVVAVPHRHALLVHPIDSIQVTTAMARLAEVATGMEREGPGSITANLYWYRHGRFLRLPYTLERGTLKFAPPPAFVEMLERLA